MAIQWRQCEDMNIVLIHVQMIDKGGYRRLHGPRW